MNLLRKSDYETAVTDSATTLNIENGKSKNCRDVFYECTLDPSQTASFSHPIVGSKDRSIRRGERVVVTTNEEFTLPETMMGICFNRPYNELQGLRIDATLIKPLHKGVFYVGIHNVSKEDVQIEGVKVKIVLFDNVISTDGETASKVAESPGDNEDSLALIHAKQILQNAADAKAIKRRNKIVIFIGLFILVGSIVGAILSIASDRVDTIQKLLLMFAGVVLGIFTTLVTIEIKKFFD